MTAWFAQDLILWGKIPFFRDLASYFYPIRFRVAAAFHAGQLPLWDTHMAGGFPLLAEFQSAVFYPPTVLFHFLPFVSAVRASYVLHFVIAASGSYVLLRSWKYPSHICIIGALLFSFGGTTVSLTNVLNHFQSAVWLAWVIYCWERAIQTQRWSSIVGFSIVALCQLLAGSPEIFLLSIVLVVLDTLCIPGERAIRTVYERVALLGVSGLVIVGLGMVQLLPTTELFLQSRRDQAIPIVEALAWSMHPSSLIGIFFPVLEADAELSSGVRLLFADGLPFLLSNYLGNIALLGMCLWCVHARAKERFILVALIGVSLLCAFGRYTPVYPFVYQWLPPVRMIRFPEKFYYLTFALAVLTAVKGFRLLAEKGTCRTTSVVSITIAAFWTIMYLTFRWNPSLLAYCLEWFQLAQAAVNPRTIASVLVGLERQIAFSTVLAGILVLHNLNFLRSRLLQPLMVCLVFVDLVVTNKPLLFTRDQSVIQKAPRILEKQPDPGRIFYYPPGENLHPSFVRVTGNLSYEKGLEIALNNLLPNAGLLYGFEYFQDIDALGRRSYTDFLAFINSLAADRRGKLLRAVNVKYVVAFHSLDVKGLERVREFPEHYSTLYEVTNAVPRAYVVGRTIFDPDGKTTLERMSSDSFDPLRDVILDAPIQLQAEGHFQGDAVIKLYESDRVQIDAQLNEPGVLVLADAFYPGWKVFVDDKEKKIRRANYLFRAVELPAGNHRVEFVYDPLSFKIGLLISSLTATLLIAVPLVRWILRRIALRRTTSALLPAPSRLTHRQGRTN